MKKVIKDLLHFTRTERQGFLLMAALVMGVYCYPFVCRPRRDAVPPLLLAGMPLLSKPTPTPIEPFPFNPNTAEFETLVQVGLPEKIANRILNYREHGGRFDSPSDFKKLYGLTPDDFQRLKPFLVFSNAGKPGAEQHPRSHRDTTFAFDPNTISRADLIRLGVPEKTATIWIKFREKGAVFRRPSDVQKIYGVDEALFERLKPLLVFQPWAEKPVAYGTGQRPKAITPIDINTAVAADWESLPGIGGMRAQRILDYRNKLGGFEQVEQVAETRGLPDSVFQSIRSYLRESAVLRKIPVNTATVEELRQHPYISPKQATLLVAYREQHGRFKSLADVESIVPLRDPVWLAKVEAYLEY